MKYIAIAATGQESSHEAIHCRGISGVRPLVRRVAIPATRHDAKPVLRMANNMGCSQPGKGFMPKATPVCDGWFINECGAIARAGAAAHSEDAGLAALV